MDTSFQIESILTTTDEQFFSLYQKNCPEQKPLFENIQSQYKFLKKCRVLRDSAIFDTAKLKMMEITGVTLVEKLRSLLDRAKKSTGDFPSETIIDGIYIEIWKIRDPAKCWLCDHQELSSHRFKLLNACNKQELNFVELNLHLIEKHDYFDFWVQNRMSFNDTSLDPIQICKLFELATIDSASLDEESTDSSSDSDFNFKPEIGSIFTASQEDIKFLFTHPGYNQSMEEFLETFQTRKEIAMQDRTVLTSFGVTHKQLFNQLKDIILKSASNKVVYDIFRVIKEDVSDTCTGCIFCTYVEKTNCFYTIENIQNGQKIKFGQFALHFLEKHDYFSTPASGEYRIDPKIACEVLEQAHL